MLLEDVDLRAEARSPAQARRLPHEGPVLSVAQLARVQSRHRTARQERIAARVASRNRQHDSKGIFRTQVILRPTLSFGPPSAAHIHS